MPNQAKTANRTFRLPPTTLAKLDALAGAGTRTAAVIEAIELMYRLRLQERANLEALARREDAR